MFGRKKAVPAQAPVEEIEIQKPKVEEPKVQEPVAEESEDEELTEEKVKGYLQILFNEVAKIKHHLRIDF